MQFLKSDTGAVTVDWVVLTAALVGLGIATMTVVSSGVQDTTDDTNAFLTSNLIATSFGLGGSEGNFEDTSGMTCNVNQYYGEICYGPTLPGWDILAGANAMLLPDGWVHIDAAEGNSYLNMGGGNAGTNLEIARIYDDARPGETYTLSMSAADYNHRSGGISDNSVEVYWGGELLGLVDPSSAEMEEFTFDVTGYSGDGSNELRIKEVGSDATAHGTLLDAIALD